MSATRLTDGDRVLLRGVSWELYAQLRCSEDRRNVRMTYVSGVLEVMSPSRIHERLTRLISKLLEVWAEEYEIEVDCDGSTTMQREDLSRGLEPDNSYYVQHAESMRDRDQLDLLIDPPPDIVIEVDITSSSTGRLPIYAELGVSEVWRCDGRALKFYLLNSRGVYQEIGASATFPPLAPDDIMRFVDQRFDVGQTSLVKQFREWVRTQKSTGNPPRTS